MYIVAVLGVKITVRSHVSSLHACIRLIDDIYSTCILVVCL